jgi:hypothetical protein
MSLWGDKELIASANSGTIELANTVLGVVTGSGTDFVTDIAVGNFIRSNDILYVVTAVTNASSITVGPGYLGDTMTAIAANSTYSVSQAPLSSAYTDGTLNVQVDALTTIANTSVSDSDIVFVDVTEAGSANNGARGLGTGGWTKYVTYLDSGGVQRYKTEVLVAMKRTAAEAGDAEDTVTADS